MKKIAVLGSTGSIGRCALDVISRHPERFGVVALAAGSNHGLLLKQIEEFRPEIAAMSDREAAKMLREKVEIPVFEGEEGVCAAASYGDADFVLSAIVGFAGLMPTVSAIRAGKNVGLANKETLVAAGDMVMKEAAERGVEILPVDSEHSAVFQCLLGAGRGSVKRIILTASGGPFVGKTAEELDYVMPEDALKHPNWKMGEKITIDSATLMNKGLEVIEAHHLFGLEADSIDVVIHPQSIMHSMVEFSDGCIMAQMSVPDMRGPIAYALSYPERLDDVMTPLDFTEIGALSFARPDLAAFPCLSYAYEAAKEKGAAPAVLNASNEVAVEAFLARKIGFNDIAVVIRKTLDGHRPSPVCSIEDVVEADARARMEAMRNISTLRRAVKG